MLPIKQNLPTDQRELLALHSKLNQGDRQSLLSFAGFLVSQQMTPEAPITEPVSQIPLKMTRPRNESVVKAIRRLSETYPMLDSKDMLDGTSLLMSAHILQGRSAQRVIDELEQLFEQRYTVFVSLD